MDLQSSFALLAGMQPTCSFQKPNLGILPKLTVTTCTELRKTIVSGNSARNGGVKCSLRAIFSLAIPKNLSLFWHRPDFEQGKNKVFL